MMRVLALAALVLAGVIGLVAMLPTPDDPEVRAAPALAITNVRVFDGDTMTGPTTVLIENGRIAAIDPALALPAGAETLNAQGLTALPGLIDAHTHTYGDVLRTSLRFGVTTNLDMFSSPLLLAGARTGRESADPTDLADWYSAGMLATAPGGHGTQFGVPVETLTAPDQAVDWVSDRLAEGSDYIKLVYMPYQSRLPSLDYATAAAVIAAAHAEGVLAVAHVYSLEGAREMVEAGINGLVHVFADAPVDAAFIEAAREAELFVIPTLTVLGSINGQRLGARLAEDPRVADDLTAVQRRSLEGGFGAAVGGGFDFVTGLENVRRLHEAGIAILAGSDAPNPGTIHGASLHQELALLVEAGLTPVEALRAATAAPADQFGLTERGRITPGARADLLLVNGDPTRAIDASLSIAQVFKNGAPVARTTLSAQRPTPLFEPGPISAFEDGLTAPQDLIWSATDDSLFGGASSAEIERVDGVLRVRASVRPGFFAPWAGAAVFRDAAAVANLSALTTLSFRARGAPGEYRVMMFMDGAAGAPPTQTFTLGPSWMTVQMELDAFEGFASEGFVGLAVVAGPGETETEFDIADVMLE